MPVGDAVKILLICHHDPDTNVIGSVRVRKFAEYLSARGGDVRVLSHSGVTEYPKEAPLATLVPELDYRQGAQCTQPYSKEAGAQPAAELRHYSVGRYFRPTLAWVFRNLIAIPDREVFSLGRMLRHSRNWGNWTPDIVVVSGPPFSTFFLAERLATKYKAPLVADYRDLWTLSGYYTMGRIRKLVDRALEKWLIKHVSLATTVSKPLSDELSETFGVWSELVLNGYDPNDLANLPLPSGMRSGLPLRIVYTGEIYEDKRDPGPLFEALAAMKFKPDQIQIEFYGDTVGILKDSAKRHGVAQLVKFAPRLDYHRSLALQRDSDVLLLLMWNNPSERGVYAGKIFEYLGARRPILMLGYSEGVAADLIRGRGAGVVANNSEDIAAALGDWLEAKREYGLVPILPESVCSGLTRYEQVEVLEQLLRKLLSGNSPQIPA